METKQLSLRLLPELIDYVNTDSGSLAKDMSDAIRTLRAIRNTSTYEIKGLFTAPEWMFLIDSLNGYMQTESFCCNAGALIAHCDDAEKYEGVATRYGINLDALSQKISALHGANIEAIYYRVSHFWAHPEASLEEYSDF